MLTDMPSKKQRAASYLGLKLLLNDDGHWPSRIQSWLPDCRLDLTLESGKDGRQKKDRAIGLLRSFAILSAGATLQ
jgi:hypothetical protein